MIPVRYFILFGKTIYWYTFLNVASYFVLWAFLIVLTLRHMEDLGEKSKPWALIKTFLFTSVMIWGANAMNTLLAKWFTQEHANYFGNLFFAPLFMLILCLILKIEPKKRLDYYIPGLGLALAVCKSACFCAGCCYGKYWGAGMYNYVNRRFEVPCALIEGIIAILLFLLLIFLRNKVKRGTIAPIYVFLYGFTRFFVEFLRDDMFPFIYFHMNVWQLQCIAAMILGGIGYVIAVKYEKKPEKI